MSQKNQCNICEKVINGNSYHFKAHMYQHKAVKPRYKCSFCSQEFFRSDVFSRHMSRHTGSLKKKCYICDHCDRSFAVKRNLQLHLRIHDDYSSYKYSCIACGVGYCEERLLKYHIRKAHYNLKENLTEGDKEVNNLTEGHKEVNETWVERVKQSETYVQMTKLSDNVVSIRKLGEVKAEVKHKLPDEEAEFKDYISSVFAQNDKSQYSKATCDYCNKEMLKKSLLSHIRERHLKIRRFHCDQCGRSFMRHYQLVDHICGAPRRRKNKLEV